MARASKPNLRAPDHGGDCSQALLMGELSAQIQLKVPEPLSVTMWTSAVSPPL